VTYCSSLLLYFQSKGQGAEILNLSAVVFGPVYREMFAPATDAGPLKTNVACNGCDGLH
jgi:hypothetical protein